MNYSRIVASLEDNVLVFEKTCNCTSRKLVYANPLALNTLGYSFEELTSFSCGSMKIFPNFDFCKTVKETRGIDSLNLDFVSKNGNIIHTKTTILKISFKTRDIIVVIFADISKKQESEKLLALQGKALDSIKNSVLITDENFNLVYFNDYSENLFCQDGSLFIDKKVCQGFLNSLTNEKRERIIYSLKTFSHWSGEITVKTANNNIPVIISISKFEYDGEEYYIGIGYSIEKTKKLQAKITRFEKTLNDMFINNPASMLLLEGKTGDILRANQAACDFYGYPTSKILSMNAVDLTVSNEDFSTLLLSDNKHLYSKHLLADGEIRDVEIHRTFIEDNKEEYIYSTIHDITDRINAEAEINSLITRLKNSHDGMIKIMNKIIEIRDPYTASHNRKVGSLATEIAKKMNLSPLTIERVSVAAILHDIGKISVPTDVLAKSGKLLPVEFEMIKYHVEMGASLLEELDSNKIISEIVKQHHERLDGSGYPRGLKGEQIMLEARIIAVADVVEAISSHRPYRPALGVGKALDEIQLNKGKLYDPAVVMACLDIFEEGFEFRELYTPVSAN